MTTDDTSDAVLLSVGRLSVLTPDEQRAGRLRARCRSQFVRRAPEPRRGYGPALLAGFGLLYLSAVVHDVLRLRGLF